MKPVGRWVLVGVGVVGLVGLVWLWQGLGDADRVDASAVVPVGANAPTENTDLETLRHIREMSGNEQGR